VPVGFCDFFTKISTFPSVLRIFMAEFVSVPLGLVKLRGSEVPARAFRGRQLPPKSMVHVRPPQESALRR
jgi:hypothetical protein